MKYVIAAIIVMLLLALITNSPLIVLGLAIGFASGYRTHDKMLGSPTARKAIRRIRD